MKKNRKIIINSAIVLLVLAGIYFIFFGPEKKEFTWRTQQVQKGDVAMLVNATGTINPLVTVQVGTQVTGTIARLFVDYNSVVKEGDVVALIDTRLLSASEKDVEAAEQKAEVQSSQYKKEFNRAQKLFNEGVIARSDYDLAFSNYKSAVSAVLSAKAQLNRAKINLEYATINAPISGTVISRNVDVGQTVVSSFNTPTLFTIANDLTKMQVYANVDEADIGQIKEGQEAVFTVDAYPDETFTGTIKQIRLQPQVIQNVVNYTVLIDVPNPDLKLMPGLTANINVKVKEHNNVMKVPMNALHFSPPEAYFKLNQKAADTVRIGSGSEEAKNKKVIWLKREKDILPVEVITGISDGNFVEVNGRIKPGEEVISGLAAEENNTTPSSSNPFVPKFPPRKKRT